MSISQIQKFEYQKSLSEAISHILIHMELVQDLIT